MIRIIPRSETRRDFVGYAYSDFGPPFEHSVLQTVHLIRGIHTITHPGCVSMEYYRKYWYPYDYMCSRCRRRRRKDLHPSALRNTNRETNHCVSTRRTDSSRVYINIVIYLVKYSSRPYDIFLSIAVQNGNGALCV